ncbi:hypothetical protein [uncultured Bosea sp.]|uniref:hypothetical protein n=1 Tax=uncultured Bosea sp. TaxID=211457 RepID=UPI0025CD4EF4|nr:hypothetical protein [uncultured Bosea sp.]
MVSLRMSSLFQLSVELFGWMAPEFLERHVERRKLIRQETVALIAQAGPGAFDAAQQVAQLARRRGDVKATKLWLDIATEVVRRDAKGRR